VSNVVSTGERENLSYFCELLVIIGRRKHSPNREGIDKTCSLAVLCCQQLVAIEARESVGMD